MGPSVKGLGSAGQSVTSTRYSTYHCNQFKDIHVHLFLFCLSMIGSVFYMQYIAHFHILPDSYDILWPI